MHVRSASVRAVLAPFPIRPRIFPSRVMLGTSLRDHRGVQSVACTSSWSVWLLPTIAPAELIPLASLTLPPSVGSSDMTPSCQTKGAILAVVGADRSQVGHDPVAPQERVARVLVAGERAGADDLARRIDGRRHARVPAEGAEAGLDAALVALMPTIVPCVLMAVARA